MKPWLKDGKVIMESGKVVLCTDCPCGEQPEDCTGKVQQYLQARYAEEDPVSHMPLWSYVASYTSDFSCSVWQEVSDSDSDSTNNAHIWLYPSTGRLLVAIPRLMLPLESVTTGGYQTYISATEIYCEATGEHRVVGCQCTFNTQTYECEETFGVTTWASIAGLCPVRQPVEVEQSTSESESLPPMYEYHEEWVCDVEQCDRYQLTVSAYHWWFGGCLDGEGYTDWWLDTPPEQWWRTGNFTNWQNYYGFSKHLITWRFRQSGVWYQSSVPCNCDTIATTTRPEGAIVHQLQGICEDLSDCDMTVMIWARHYTEMEGSSDSSSSGSSSGSESSYWYTCDDYGNGLWEQVASARADYSCALWEKDENQQWVLKAPASGTLAIVYTRSSTGKPTITTQYGSTTKYVQVSMYRTTIAITLRNKETGVYKTLCCKCDRNTTTRTCTSTFADLDNTCFGMYLPARTEETYRLGLCDADMCMAVEGYFPLMEQWYGVTDVGECIVDDYDSTRSYYTWTYRPYRRGCRWTEGGEASSSGSSSSSDSGTKYAALMACGCDADNQGDSINLTVVELDDSHRLCTAAGVCSSDCQKVLALKASARERGWTDHGSGVLRHKRARQVSGTIEVLPYLDLFSGDNDLTNGGASLVIVEGDVAWYGVGCGCTPTGSANTYRVSEKLKASYYNTMWSGTAPDGYWKFLSWNVEDGCSCIDNRKLALDYPDLFGIEDISYGTNTTYDVTASGPVPSYNHPIVQNWQGWGYMNRYVDFRTMCMIINTFDNMQQLNWISPSGSPFNSMTGQYPEASMSQRICYDTITFTGHCPLFSRFWYEHPLTHGTNAFDFSGTTVYYESIRLAICNDDPDPDRDVCTRTSSGCGTLEVAQLFANKTCHNSNSLRNSSNSYPYYYPYTDWQTGECLYQSGKLESCPNDRWNGYPTIYQAGKCADVEKGDGTTERRYLIYWLQYMQTNRGIAINGVEGFKTSWTQKEAGDHDTFCNAESDYGNYHDTTINAQLIDTDMHWCAGNEPDDWSDSSSSS